MSNKYPTPKPGDKVTLVATKHIAQVIKRCENSRSMLMLTAVQKITLAHHLGSSTVEITKILPDNGLDSGSFMFDWSERDGLAKAILTSMTKDIILPFSAIDFPRSYPPIFPEQMPKPVKTITITDCATCPYFAKQYPTTGFCGKGAFEFIASNYETSIHPKCPLP